MTCIKNSPESRHSAGLWITLLAAASVGTAALIIIRKRGFDATLKGIDDLLETCDQAARALDERVCPQTASA